MEKTLVEKIPAFKQDSGAYSNAQTNAVARNDSTVGAAIQQSKLEKQQQILQLLLKTNYNEAFQTVGS